MSEKDTSASRRQSFQELNHRRFTAVERLKGWLNTPYLWGGDDFSGFDCSGLVVEVLQSVGILPREYDWTADDLLEKFRPAGKVRKAPIWAGCLVFFLDRPSHRAVHVAMASDNRFIIHASGGGRGTTRPEDAIRDDAFVKQDDFRMEAERRRRRYKQETAVVDPFKYRGDPE